MPLAAPRADLLLLLFLVAGCGQPTLTVEGTVRYEGNAVNDGFIAFNPTDGKGSTAGAPIKMGRYKVVGLLPGKRVVEVAAPPTVEEVRFLPEDLSQLKSPATTSPGINADAVGNNQIVNITGNEKIDFDLKKPVKGQ